MKDSKVYNKSKKFAIRIVKLYKFLTDESKEFVLSKQLLRSGTSIGANLSEALCAVSRPDFLNKVHISFKECNETKYWLELLKDTEFLTAAQYNSICLDVEEIFKLLHSTVKTTKTTLARKPSNS